MYVIKKPSIHTLDAYSGEREVLFRCGNWCYLGRVTLDFGNAAGPTDDNYDSDGGKDGAGDEHSSSSSSSSSSPAVPSMCLADVPRIIPILQRQQSKLAFYCNATNIPRTSDFYDPIEAMSAAQNFIADELQSNDVTDRLQEMEDRYPWMSSDEVKSYFELTANVPDVALQDIQCICSKTYTRGLIFITMYFDNTFYVTIAEGMGDQPLLDVRFPNVSSHGEGLSLKRYTDGGGANDDREEHKYHSLVLWQSLADDGKRGGSSNASLQANAKLGAKNKTKNLSSDSYIQSYCVLKPNAEGSAAAAGVSSPSSAGTGGQFRTALFRFGSWCYSGRVQLVETLSLSDLPHVIPALRLQQSRLEFFCDVGVVPARSPFVRPLEYALRVAPVMESEVVGSEPVLQNLVSRLSSMGLGDSISQWLDGDPTQSFFEFAVAPDADTERAHKNVEIMCSKCYTPNGLVTVTIYFQGVYYLTIQEGHGEQPLLDSKFPNVAGKGRGYQIAAYSNGVEGWPSLRKVSVWQTASAMQLEMEQRMTKVRATHTHTHTQHTHTHTETRDARRREDDAAPRARRSVVFSLSLLRVRSLGSIGRLVVVSTHSSNNLTQPANTPTFKPFHFHFHLLIPSPLSTSSVPPSNRSTTFLLLLHTPTPTRSAKPSQSAARPSATPSRSQRSVSPNSSTANSRSPAADSSQGRRRRPSQEPPRSNNRPSPRRRASARRRPVLAPAPGRRPKRRRRRRLAPRA